MNTILSDNTLMRSVSCELPGGKNKGRAFSVKQADILIFCSEAVRRVFANTIVSRQSPHPSTLFEHNNNN